VRVGAGVREGLAGGTRIVRFIATLATVVVILAGCAASASPSPSADVQRQADLYGINQIEVTWHAASSQKDVDLMMSIWSKDATFTTAGKTYTGADQIRQFFATQAAPFKKENNWVSDTPAYKSRVTIDGDKGTLYFECDYIDVATRQVKLVVSADQTVARIDGKWTITAAISATPTLGG
jgi:SnoaL-like domain